MAMALSHKPCTTGITDKVKLMRDVSEPDCQHSTVCTRLFLNNRNMTPAILNTTSKSNRYKMAVLHGHHRVFRFVAFIVLSLLVHSGIAAEAGQENFYIRAAHGVSSDSNGTGITSLGALSLENNMIGHADLTYLDSENDGKALSLEFGAGVAYDWQLSPYLSIGASLGYNWDSEEYIAAWFPEIGLIVNITNRFGVSVSGRRYYSLYEEDEDIVSLGLVFRN